jgi:hypothetical protein
MKNRAKKGGEIGMNGEFYKGGLFLPSTQLPKQSPIKIHNTTTKKPMADWQIKNLERAIEGTKKALHAAIERNDKLAIEGNTAQLERYMKMLNQQ